MSQKTLDALLRGLEHDPSRLQHLLHQTAHLAAVAELTFYQAQVPPPNPSELVENCAVASGLLEKVSLQIQEHLKPEIFVCVARGFLQAQGSRNQLNVHSIVAQAFVSSYDQEALSMIVAKIQSPKQVLTDFLAE